MLYLFNDLTRFVDCHVLVVSILHHALSAIEEASVLELEGNDHIIFLVDKAVHVVN